MYCFGSLKARLRYAHKLWNEFRILVKYILSCLDTNSAKSTDLLLTHGPILGLLRMSRSIS